MLIRQSNGSSLLARITMQVPDADNATYSRLTKEESRDKECHAKSSRLTKKNTGPFNVEAYNVNHWP
jgi:hypothetical protein